MHTLGQKVFGFVINCTCILEVYTTRNKYSSDLLPTRFVRSYIALLRQALEQSQAALLLIDTSMHNNIFVNSNSYNKNYFTLSIYNNANLELHLYRTCIEQIFVDSDS